MKKIIFLFVTMFLAVNGFGIQPASAQQLKEVDIYLELFAQGAADQGSSVYIGSERHFFNGSSSLSFSIPVGTQIRVEVISSGSGWLYATGYEPRFVIEPVAADFYYYVTSDWESVTNIYIGLLDN